MASNWHRLSAPLGALAVAVVWGHAAVAADPAAAGSVPELEGSVHQLPPAAGVTIGEVQYTLGDVTPDRNLEAAILDQLPGYDNCDDDPGQGLRYFYDRVDLNDDGAAKSLVYLVGRYACGTGGCTALILQSDDGTDRLIARLNSVDNPIVVSDQTTNGWRDLILYVSGGGAAPAYHVLQHSGAAYPENPSVAPMLEEGAVVDGHAYIADGSVRHTSPRAAVKSLRGRRVRPPARGGLGDLRIDLGGDQVVTLLGSPDVEGEVSMSEADALFHQVWRYPDQGVVLDMVSEAANGPQVIGSIQIDAPSTLKTRLGIGIGDSYGEVATAYAPPGERETLDPPATLAAGSDYGGLLFFFDREHKVSWIRLGAAAE